MNQKPARIHILLSQLTRCRKNGRRKKASKQTEKKKNKQTNLRVKKIQDQTHSHRLLLAWPYSKHSYHLSHRETGFTNFVAIDNLLLFLTRPFCVPLKNGHLPDISDQPKPEVRWFNAKQYVCWWCLMEKANKIEQLGGMECCLGKVKLPAMLFIVFILSASFESCVYQYGTFRSMNMQACAAPWAPLLFASVWRFYKTFLDIVSCFAGCLV